MPRRKQKKQNVTLLVLDAQTQALMADLRHRFAALYGPRLVLMMLYGSQARGEAELGSDIDVLVVLRGPVSPGEEIVRTGEIVAELSLRFDKVLSCLFMDEERFTHRNGPLLRNVRKEGVMV
jgi:predicted nucleotidyltransferase